MNIISGRRKSAIVVGTGAGGAAIARRLQEHFQVTMLEAGGDFHPFSMSVDRLAGLRKTGLFFDERMISLLLPNMRVEKTPDMVLVRGIGAGGTTTLATGNAVRCDGALRGLGIDLDSQFERLYRELPVTTDHADRWNGSTKAMFRVFDKMGLDPVVTPKFLDAQACIRCGHCAIGCPAGAKWDTRSLVDDALKMGARLVQNCRVYALRISRGSVTEVLAFRRGRKESYRADVVVLAAGGLGTPVILENSGIECDKTLFVDPVLCVAGELDGLRQDRQLLMPFISQQDGYILSPYMDYLSYFFNRDWRRSMKGLASVMIKLSDEEKGSVEGKKIYKTMSGEDHSRMAGAVLQCREILERLGVPASKQFLGTLNAGHPGGMLPLKKEHKDTLHDPRLPQNLYVADATILPQSLGNPPILTIMALALKIADVIESQDF